MESVFKAKHALRKSTRGLLETRICLDPLRRTFQSKIDSPDASLPPVIDGVFTAEDGLILTAATIPATQPNEA